MNVMNGINHLSNLLIFYSVLTTFIGVLGLFILMILLDLTRNNDDFRRRK